ncbi:MBL fold metallo-hydrolase [Natronobacterium gregoryi]|uniref:Beta-lactamase n=2 Tax=Natronobacterium gregoryi TaxID=44930 RepID=L0ANX1_NATGS|nr:MBL fold metallo-hydrolase [Natronobacterium gregoryi]AFZ74780.1 Zn-dependent hydrolase, glyoxylase [Natronobacterium gregoryi SP2]ELY73547.1 beta-lactamase [Natronobacterium gregoryi SP2]PLK19425.1 MBL fold metallo-hydrolase [Natronobacterium gregoryi SP2]SFJ49311.1 Glyoxylase, beta-lactamase superfamily II [Natronobacterium gregoryi]
MDRITLGNDEFEGRNNAYVLEDGDTLALVDTGIAMTDVRSDLEDGLADRGYEFADVDDIVLTHYHVDHAGLAGEIQAESGATVYVHEADVPLVEDDADALERREQRQRDLLEQWGVPEDAKGDLFAFLDRFDEIEGDPVDATPIEDGDSLQIGGRTLEAVHAPGHAAGLCCFEIEDGSEAFVGDALLPVYTPNVGGADVRVERPLKNYLETLRTIVDRDYDRVWPGHRDPIEEPTERALTIVDHHRERTEEVLAVLEAHGPADPWTVSDHLFGDLQGIHVIHGPGEAYAHLDHLYHEDVVAYEDGEYRLRVEPTDVDLESLFPAARRAETAE